MKKGVIENKYVKWFSELTSKDVSLVGDKALVLAEIYNAKFPVPLGFIITSEACRYFLESSNIDKTISSYLAKLNPENQQELDKASAKITELIENTKMPGDLEADIMEAYEILGSDNSPNTAKDILRKSNNLPFVAVRSSSINQATGQHETFSNTRGFEELLANIKRCFASLFTARAIYYRAKKSLLQNSLAVIVQEMVNSEKSGIVFSRNPLEKNDRVIIEAVWGLGQGIVSGEITPDHYEVNEKLDLVDFNISEKNYAIVKNHKGKTDKISLDEEKSNSQVLSGSEIKRLAQYAIQLEEHYGKPQDLEFAIANENIYLLQSRPLELSNNREEVELEGNVLINGLVASPGLVAGQVKIVKSLADLHKISKGDVLVTEVTRADILPSLSRAGAIISDQGGLTSHSSSLARQFNIPALVAAKQATTKLKEGQLITVDAFTGRVLEGKLEAKRILVKPITSTKTEIKVLVDVPDYAVHAAESGAKSVGLVKLESIIASSGKHPISYLKKNKLKNYSSLLYHGLKKISESFSSVWIRTSDIRSDEYKSLEGAPTTVEQNPLLGDHGIRFGLRNQDLLESELTAIKDLADEFPDKKFGIMFPKVISSSEVSEAIKIANSLSMPSNIGFGIVVETPASVGIIEDLCKDKLISFASINIPSLTQYTLAVDRNNENLKSIYHDSHPSVLKSIAHVIQVCKNHDIVTSAQSQVFSRELTEFLVRQGINSISVSADQAHQLSNEIAEIERSLPQAQTQLAKRQIPRELDEESIILDALDDYSPSIPQGKEIPSLNDSIPIGPEDFMPKKQDNSLNLER